MSFFRRIAKWWRSIHRDWRYDNEHHLDLAELSDEDMTLPVPLSNWDDLVNTPVSDRAAAKALRRQARGAPAHKIRQSLPQPGSPIVEAYPSWLDEDPPWMKPHDD